MTRLNQPGDAMEDFAAREQRQFRRIFQISVVVFVAVGAIARMLPRGPRPWKSERPRRRSLIAEAKAAANRFIPFAFMG